MTSGLLLTNVFKEMYSTVYPEVSLNLIPIKREHALVYPLLYPQFLSDGDLSKLASLIELEDDEDFIRSTRSVDTEKLINDVKLEKQQVGELSRDKLWEQNDKSLLLLEEERKYLTSLLDAVVNPNTPEKLREEGIILMYRLSKCKTQLNGSFVSEDWLKFRLAKVNQIYNNVSYLLKEIPAIADLKITPFIYFGEYGIAEMFIEFEGMFILVKIMSNSVGAKLRWREDRQAVFIYRKNGKKAWNAATDAIQKDFKQQEIFIRDCTNLMGISSRQRRRPVMKVLLLEGSIIDSGNNPESLSNDVPGHTYLNIKGNSNVFVFDVEGFVVFLLTAAARKYFKRNPEMSELNLLPTEDCSEEEAIRRLEILICSVAKSK